MMQEREGLWSKTSWNHRNAVPAALSFYPGKQRVSIVEADLKMTVWILDDKVCCRLISGGISEFGGCVMWAKHTTPNRRDFPVTIRLRGADQLVTSFSRLLKKS